MGHDNLTDFGTGDFFVLGTENISFYSIYHGFQLLTGNGTLIACSADTVNQLIAVILLPVLVLLNYS